MADWFEENAPATTPKPGPSGDWFKDNAPTSEPSFGQKFWQGFTQPYRDLADVATGAVKGAGETAHNLADIATGGYYSKLAPTWLGGGDTSKAFAPSNEAQQFGKTAERTAEYLAPGGVTAKIGKGIDTATAAMRGRSAVRALGKAITEGTAGAGVAGVQSGGDTGEMAKTGALIGGTSLAMRGVGAGVQAAKTALTKVNPDTAFFQGFRPRANQVEFKNALQRGIPEIRESARQMTGQATLLSDAESPIGTFEDFIAKADNAKQRLWGQYEQMLGPRAYWARDTSPVADAIEASIPKKVAFENPSVADATRALANRYRTKMTLQEMEQLLQDSNAELAAYEAKYPAMKHAALRSNPETAATAATADTLRDLLYRSLDDMGDGVAARDLKLRYGAVSELQQTAMRQKVIAERQAPQTLAQQLAWIDAAKNVARGAVTFPVHPLRSMAEMGTAAVEPAAAKWMRDVNSRSGLIRRAFEQYQGQYTPVDIPPPQVVPQSRRLPSAPIVTPPPEDASGVTVTTGKPLLSHPSRQLPPASRLPRSRQIGAGPLVTPSPPDTSGVTITTGPPLEPPRAPASRQLPRGAIQMPPPGDQSGVKALDALPVIDPETGEILYYSSEAKTPGRRYTAMPPPGQ